MYNNDNASRIWVGNLSDRVDEELLYELFLQAGPLDEVQLPRNNDGRPKPFCFVKFKHECSVPYAVELFKDTALFGRELCIKPKERNVLPREDNTKDDGLNALRGLSNLFKEENSMSPSRPEAFGFMPRSSQTAAPDFDALLKMGQQLQSSIGMLGHMNQGFPPLGGPMIYPSQMQDPVMSYRGNGASGSNRNNYRSHSHSGRDFYDQPHPYRDDRRNDRRGHQSSSSRHDRQHSHRYSSSHQRERRDHH